MRFVWLLVGLSACGHAAPRAAQRQVEPEVASEHRPALHVTRIPAWRRPEPADDSGIRWVAGGVRFEMREDEPVFADQALAEPLAAPREARSGWLFPNEQGTRLWWSPSFLGPLQQVEGVPEGVSLIREGRLGTDGRIYTLGSEGLITAPALERYMVDELYDLKDGRWMIREAGGDAFASSDEGVTWDTLSRDEFTQQAQLWIEEWELRRLRYEGPIVPTVAAQALSKMPLLGLANAFATEVTELGILHQEELLSLDRSRLRIGSPSERCWSGHEIYRRWLVRHCFDGIYVYQRSGQRWFKAISFPTELEDDGLGGMRPSAATESLINNTRVISGADAAQLLADVGCRGEPAALCLIDRESGRRETIARDLPFHAFALHGREVLYFYRGYLIAMSLDSGRTRTVRAFDTPGDDGHIQSLDDGYVLASRDQGPGIVAHIVHLGGELREEVPLPAGTRHLRMATRYLGVAVDSSETVYATGDGGQSWLRIGRRAARDVEATLHIGGPIDCVQGRCVIDSWVVHSESLHGALSIDDSVPATTDDWAVACEPADDSEMARRMIGADLSGYDESTSLISGPLISAFGVVHRADYENRRGRSQVRLRWSANGSEDVLAAEGAVPFGLQRDPYGGTNIYVRGISPKLLVADVCSEERCQTVIASARGLRLLTDSEQLYRALPLRDGGLLFFGVGRTVRRMNPEGHFVDRTTAQEGFRGILTEADGRWGFVYRGPPTPQGLLDPFRTVRAQRYGAVMSDGTRTTFVLDALDALHHPCPAQAEGRHFHLLDVTMRQGYNVEVLSLRATPTGACLEAYGANSPRVLEHDGSRMIAGDERRLYGFNGAIAQAETCEVAAR